MQLTVQKLSLVRGSIIKFHQSLPCLKTVKELPRIARTIFHIRINGTCVCFLACPMLLIVNPFSTVHSSCSLDEPAMAMGFSLLETALVDVLVAIC
jgi:hypothetical protein